MSGQREMPKYKCHKEVRALKIKQVIVHAHTDPKADDDKFEASAEFTGGHLLFEDERFRCIPIHANWYLKHKPQPGGYYVVYEDGYASYSPAKTFEEGYTKL